MPLQQQQKSLNGFPLEFKNKEKSWKMGTTLTLSSIWYEDEVEEDGGASPHWLKSEYNWERVCTRENVINLTNWRTFPLRKGLRERKRLTPPTSLSISQPAIVAVYFKRKF